MKSARLICSCLFLVCAHPRGSGAPPPEAAALQKACQKNLKLIFSAIQEYRQEYRNLPTDLRQLLPTFLHDPQALVCPASVDSSSPDSCTYLYEFDLTPVAAPIRGAPLPTKREYSQLRMTLLGSKVPLVRCANHEAWLNLSFEGDIYPSEEAWEKNFLDLVKIQSLGFEPLFAAHTPLLVIRIPCRLPGLSEKMVDLSFHYNAALRQGWLGDEKASLAALGAGTESFGAIDFDVRGIIQLGSAAYAMTHYPLAVSNILVNLPGAAIHFLHGASGSEVDGKTVGEFVLHWATGGAQSFQLQYGHHLLSWHSDPDKDERRQRLQNTRVAWTGADRPDPQTGKPIYLYHTRFANPRPDLVLERIDYVSRGTGTAPFLIAISIE